MQKLLGLSVLIVLSLVNTGCSLDSALYGVKTLNPFYQKVQVGEVVSGSSQYYYTSNNYLVSASAGSVYDKVKGTTANGYKVYISVQGQMISSDEE